MKTLQWWGRLSLLHLSAESPRPPGKQNRAIAYPLNASSIPYHRNVYLTTLAIGKAMGGKDGGGEGGEGTEPLPQLQRMRRECDHL
jgi:hypothetical protein